MADVLSNLHDIQKSLEFWQSRAEVKSINQSINQHNVPCLSLDYI